MSCDITARVENMFNAYADLCARCCPDGVCSGHLPRNKADLCGDGAGLIIEVYNAVLALLTSSAAGCAGLTESNSRPAVPSPACLMNGVTATWMDTLAIWIRGISCDYSCPAGAVVGPALAASYPPGPGTCGYLAGEATYYNPMSVPANLVLSSALTVDDQLLVDGTRWNPDSCAYPYSVPGGTVLATNVSPGGAVRIGVEDNYGTYADIVGGETCWVPTSPGLMSVPQPTKSAPPELDRLRTDISALQEPARTDGLAKIAAAEQKITLARCSNCASRRLLKEIRSWYQEQNKV